MDETVYITLLEEHRELPARDAVLSRFRQAFFQRLERGSGLAQKPEPQAEPVDSMDEPPRVDEALAAEDSYAPDDDAAAFSLDEPADEPAEDGSSDTDLFGDFDDGSGEAEESERS